MPKSPGRPRTTPVGAAFSNPMSRFIDANWDRLGMTNEEAAIKLGFRGANLVSMWRTGRTAFPLTRLVQLSKLLGVDLVQLFILWLKQDCARDPKMPADLVPALEARIATANEARLLATIRTATRNSDPVFGSSLLKEIGDLIA